MGRREYLCYYTAKNKVPACQKSLKKGLVMDYKINSIYKI